MKKTQFGFHVHFQGPSVSRRGMMMILISFRGDWGGAPLIMCSKKKLQILFLQDLSSLLTSIQKR